MSDLMLRFKQLHEQDGVFIIPNPWDLGTAQMLEEHGAQALATTSSGFAATLGKRDGEVTLSEKLRHCEQLVRHVSIPVNADFENGFADDPETLVQHIRQLAETGVAGYSIEDYSRDTGVLYDLQQAVERVQAAAESGQTMLLTARAENLIRGVHDLDDTLNRLQAYAAAGADVLYAPGLATVAQVEQFCQALPRPVNVLAPLVNKATVAKLGAAGAKRLSIGGALARSAQHYTAQAVERMMNEGRFDWS